MAVINDRDDAGRRSAVNDIRPPNASACDFESS